MVILLCSNGKLIHHADTKHMKAGVGILISDKVGFKLKRISRNRKKIYFLKIKGSIYRVNISLTFFSFIEI